MSKGSFVTVARVVLGAKHLHPGRTRHTIVDASGEREFPRFERLEIAKYLNDSGFYLLHICGDGSTADTHHSTMEEAFHQAEFEFAVRTEDWEVVSST